MTVAYEILPSLVQDTFAHAKPLPRLTSANLAAIVARAVMGPDGCWIWVGRRVPGTGYGRFQIGGKDYRVHRLVCNHFNSGVSPSLVVDHLCKNPSCINPRHLEAVAVGVNTERGYNQSQRSSKQTHCKHGHLYTAENTLLQTNPSGNKSRACKTCHAARQRARRERARG